MILNLFQNFKNYQAKVQNLHCQTSIDKFLAYDEMITSSLEHVRIIILSWTQVVNLKLWSKILRMDNLKTLSFVMSSNNYQTYGARDRDFSNAWFLNLFYFFLFCWRRDVHSNIINQSDLEPGVINSLVFVDLVPRFQFAINYFAIAGNHKLRKFFKKMLKRLIRAARKSYTLHPTVPYGWKQCEEKTKEDVLRVIKDIEDRAPVIFKKFAKEFEMLNRMSWKAAQIEMNVVLNVQDFMPHASSVGKVNNILLLAKRGMTPDRMLILAQEYL